MQVSSTYAPTQMQLTTTLALKMSKFIKLQKIKSYYSKLNVKIISYMLMEDYL